MLWIIHCEVIWKGAHLQHWEQEYYADIVRMVLDILQEREKDLYVAQPPELIAYYRRLMED